MFETTITLLGIEKVARYAKLRPYIRMCQEAANIVIAAMSRPAFGRSESFIEMTPSVFVPSAHRCP